MVTANVSTNWSLFYSYHDCRPTYFAELLWVGNTLYRRQGKLHTWGQSAREEYPNEETLLSAVSQQRKNIEQEGFVQARAWCFDPSHFDSAVLQAELAAAAKEMFAALKIKHPDVNAFAIGTDHDAMTFLPIAHAFPSLADAEDGVLWCPDEWQISECDEPFDIPYRYILSQKRDELTKVEYLTYKNLVHQAAKNALEELVSRGVFGEKSQRVVLFHVNGSPAKWGSIERFNSPDLYKRWGRWWTENR
jgi:hypothetical protein